MDDPSIGDLLQDQAKAVQQNVRERVGEKLNTAGNAVFQYIFDRYPAISPLSSPHPIDRWLLILSISLVVICIFLAMQSVVTALIVALCASIPIVAMGILWKHSLLSKAAMGVCGGAVVLSIIASIFFQREQQHQKDQLQAEILENRRLAIDRVETEQFKSEEAKRKQEAEEKARLLAEEEAKKAEEDRRNKEFLAELKKNQEAEEKRRLEEQKRQEQLVAERRKQEEELRKKALAEQAAAKREEKRLLDLVAAEGDYQKKKLASDDADHAMNKLEGELRVAKEELMQQELIVERENSPRPPAAAELKRARELKSEWKQEVERISAALEKSRVEAKKAAAEKAAAAKLLDSLQKKP